MHLARMIKPSLRNNGWRNMKNTADSSDEENLLKTSYPHTPRARRRGSFILTKTDSERSITSTDPTLQCSLSTLNSSISSFASIPPPPFDSQGNDSFSSALTKADESMLPPPPFCRRVEKEEPPAATIKPAPHFPDYEIARSNSFRSFSKSTDFEYCDPRRRIQKVAHSLIKKKKRPASNKITDKSANSLDHFLDDYSKIIDEFPDKNAHVYGGSESVIGW